MLGIPIQAAMCVLRATFGGRIVINKFIISIYSLVLDLISELSLVDWNSGVGSGFSGTCVHSCAEYGTKGTELEPIKVAVVESDSPSIDCSSVGLLTGGLSVEERDLIGQADTGTAGNSVSSLLAMGAK